MTSPRYAALLFLFILGCAGLPTTLLAQRTPGKETAPRAVTFCGTHGGPADDKFVPEPGVDYLSDRFGNYYRAEDMVAGNPKSLSTTGYFIPNYIGDLPPAVQSAIDAVLLDVSGLIAQRTGDAACTDQPPVHLLVGYHDFADTDWPGWGQLRVDPAQLPPPGSGVLGLGSAFYEFDYAFDCDNIAFDLPFQRINGFTPHNASFYVGRILINASLIDVGPNATYYTGEDPAGIGSEQIDLPTVALHEMLHVLGISSRIQEGLNDYSRYDLQLDLRATDGSTTRVLEAEADRIHCYGLADGAAAAWGNSCAEDPLSLVINATNEVATQGQGSIPPDELGNLLSHLTNECDGPEGPVDYVMQPFVATGETRREVTPEELQIFCDMGYSVPGIECEGCYVIGTHQDAYFNNPCFEFLTACEYETLEVDIAEISMLQGNSEVEFGEPYARNFAAGLDLSVDNQTGLLTVAITDITYPRPIIVIPYTACDGEYSSFVTVSLRIDLYCKDCEPDVIANCENISCFTDFEDYPQPQAGREWYYTGAPRGAASAIITSLDHGRTPATGNDFVRFGSSTVTSFHEIMTLPLLNPVQPGCTFTLQMDAVTDEQADLHVWGSATPICAYNNSSFGVAFDCDYGDVVCQDGSVFTPVCVDIISDLATGADIFDQDPPFAPVARTYVNAGDTPINFLYLTLSNSRIYVDNFNITTSCPVALSVDEAPAIEACPGETATVAFEVCNGSTEAVALDGALTAPAFTALTSTPPWPLTVAAGACTTLNFTLEVAPDAPAGSATLDLNLSAAGECGQSGAAVATRDLNVGADCTNDCNLTDADIVGNTPCATYLSNLVTPGCGEVDWPADLLADRRIYIEHELVVDVNYTFRDCELIMGPGARITVTAEHHLTLVGSTDSTSRVYGCNALWEAIDLLPRSQLTVHRTRIEDGYTAINAQDGATLKVTASELLDNFVGLYLRGLVGNGVLLQEFSGNRLAQTAALLPLAGPPSLPLLPAPNDRAYAGLYLSGNQLPTTVGREPGNGDDALALTNTFTHLANGIVSYASVLKVVQSRFLDILVESPWGSYPIAGYGIHNTAKARPFAQYGPTGIGALSSFGNCNTGIYVSYGPTRIIGNRLTDCGIGVRVSDIYEHLDILQNRLIGGASTLRGFLVEDAAGHQGAVNISDNQISGTAFGGIGVYVTGGHGSAAAGGWIGNNRMQVLDHGRAINGLGLHRYTIDDNLIKLGGTGYFNLVGIQLEGGKGINVTENEIIGNGRGNGLILGQLSGAATTLECNELADLDRGVWVLGNWSATYFRNTIFRGNFIDGFSYGPQVTSMTPQAYVGTGWNGATFQGAALAHYLQAGLSNYQSILQGQRWTVDNFNPAPSVLVANYGAAGVNAWYQQTGFGPAPAFCGDKEEEPHPGTPVKEGDRKPTEGKSARTTAALAAATLAPNPTDGRLTLHYPISSEDWLTVRIYAATGVIVREYRLAADEQYGTLDLNLGDRPAGLYLVELRSGEQFRSLRVIKR